MPHETRSCCTNGPADVLCEECIDRPRNELSERMQCCTGGDLGVECAWCEHTRGTKWSAMRGPNAAREVDRVERSASAVLEEAAKVVNGARRHSYGHPLDNHGCTAEMWTAFLRRKYGQCPTLSPEDVCWLNLLQKASREANRSKEDNLVDGIGYLINIEMIQQERERRIEAAGVLPDKEAA